MSTSSFIIGNLKDGNPPGVILNSWPDVFCIPYIFGTRPLSLH